MGAIISFICQFCGNTTSVLVKQNQLTFCLNQKLYSEKLALNDEGYYKCLDCRKINNIKFSKVE